MHRCVIVMARTIFFIALLALVLDILSGHISVGHLYPFALILGLPAAFVMPATHAILPRLVQGNQLPASNGALMGSQQLMQLVAPPLAGLIIWGAPQLSGVNIASDVEPIRLLETTLVTVR